jgi:hypothetical protein
MHRVQIKAPGLTGSQAQVLVDGEPVDYVYAVAFSTAVDEVNRVELHTYSEAEIDLDHAEVIVHRRDLEPEHEVAIRAAVSYLRRLVDGVNLDNGVRFADRRVDCEEAYRLAERLADIA